MDLAGSLRDDEDDATDESSDSISLGASESSDKSWMVDEESVDSGDVAVDGLFKSCIEEVESSWTGVDAAILLLSGAGDFVWERVCIGRADCRERRAPRHDGGTDSRGCS